MVAPIDAKTVLALGDDAITLRLDFAGLSMCEHLGVDLFSEDGVPRTISKIALVVKALATTDHPALTADQALAVVARLKPLPVITTIIEMISDFGAQADGSAEGKEQAAKEEIPLDA